MFRENKGADQLRGYREADLRLCFRICKIRFSHVAAQFVSLTFPIQELTFRNNTWHTCCKHYQSCEQQICRLDWADVQADQRWSSWHKASFLIMQLKSLCHFDIQYPSCCM